MSKFLDKYRIESHRKPNWDYSGNGMHFITILTEHRECILGKIKNGKMILSDFGLIASEEWHESFRIRKELILDEFTIMPNHLHALIKIEKPVGDDLPVKTHGRASQYATAIDDENASVKMHGRASQEDIGITNVKTHGLASQKSKGKDVKTHRPTAQELKDCSNKNPVSRLKPNPSQKDITAETHVRASLPEEDINPLKNESKHMVTSETHVHAPLQNSSIQKITLINPKHQRKPKSISSFVAAFKSASTIKIDDFIDLKKLAIKKYNRYNKFWHRNYHDHIVRNKEEYWKIRNYIRSNPKNWDEDEYNEPLL